jgi:opacity protein-like surface antigen
MRRAFVFLLLLTAPLHAADIEAGGQHVLAMMKGDSGELDIATSRGFGAHVEVFWSERVSMRVTGVFLNPAAIVYPDNPPPTDIDLGTLGLDIYSATARFHFPLRGGFSAFAGAGPAFVSIGNLDDRFGEEVEIDFDPQTTFLLEGGIRYRVHPRVVLELGASYLPLELSDAPPPLQPAVGIDPLTISAGAAWRF